GLRHRRLRRGAWEPPHRHPLHRRSRHSPSGPSAGALRPSHRIASTRAASRGALCPARRRVMPSRAGPHRRSGRRARAPDDRSQREGRGHREEHVHQRRSDPRYHSAHPHEGIAARSHRPLHPGERFPRHGDRETPFGRPDQRVGGSGGGSGPVGSARRRWEGRRALNENGFLAPGDRVLLTLSRTGNTRTYTISEIVRLPSLWPFVVILAVALVVVGRWKGLASLAGLGASIAVFLLAVLPAVRNGDDPLLATLIGSIGVLVVAVFVVHGFNRKSIAALVGTLGTLVLVVALAAAAIGIARITGLGTEDAIFVFVGTAGKVDMPRLVLAGVVVAS